MAASAQPVVLVLGASGMLGRAVHKVLQQESASGVAYRVVGTGHSRAADLGLRPLDVTDTAALSSFLEGLAPAVVVNCVAERRPDRVERDEAYARRLNVELVERLAAFTATQGCHLVNISTDYVFDGTAPPYAPDDAPNPLNAYGRHKLEAEEAIRKHPTLAADSWLILRVPVLYGESADLDESSITALAKDALAGPRTRVDDWSARFPTHTGDVAEVLRRVVAGGFQGTTQDKPGAFLSGIHHFSSKERQQADGRPHTKFTLSRMIGEILGKPTDHLEADPNPGAAGGAARPKDCELDITALAAALGPLPQTPLKEGLAAVLTPLVG